MSRFAWFPWIVAGVIAGMAPAEAQIYARGSYYVASDELGASGEWGADSGNQLVDDGTRGDAVAGDGIWSRRITATEPAGLYEFKVGAVDWSVGFPDGFNINIGITTDTDTAEVLVVFDINVYNDGWVPSSNFIWSDRLSPWTEGWYVVGSPPELGEWEPADGVPASVPFEDLYRAVVPFANTSSFSYKWTVDRAWGRQEVTTQGYCLNDGDHNFLLTVPPGTVEFFLNPATGRAAAGPTGSVPVQDASWGRIKHLYLDR